MEKYECFVLVFLTISAVLQPAQAIKCYQCFGAICGDPFDATMVLQVDCPGLCEKTKVTGFISKDAEALNQVKVGDVLRWCNNSTRKPGCEDQVKSGVNGRVCFCKTNLCNGGYDVRISMARETIILLILFILHCFL